MTRTLQMPKFGWCYRKYYVRNWDFERGGNILPVLAAFHPCANSCLNLGSTPDSVNCDLK